MSRLLPSFYTERQMIDLARSPDSVSRKGLRDRAILSVLCATGVRVSELVALKPAELSSSLVFVRHGKGGVQRYVPISSAAGKAVSRYLAVHPVRPGDQLFRTLDGRPLTRRLVHKIVTGYSRPLGLKSGVHVIRHSFATRALNRGMSLQSVRAMLGHSHLSTTGIYLWVATSALAAEYRRCLEGGVGR